MSNATPIEVAWSTVALIGLALLLWSCWDAWLDWRALARSGRDGHLRLVAAGNVRQQILRTSVQVLFLTSGMIAILLPAPCVGMETTPFYVGVSTCLLGAQIILVAGEFLDRRNRHAVLAQSLRGRPAEP
jgi:hypothetical protein